MRLLPGVRLVDRPGVLYFFDGRRVVSLRGDEGARRAVRAALAEPSDGDGDEAVRDAAALLDRLRLAAPAPGPEVSVPAAFASAAVAGWVSPQLAEQRLADVEVHVWDESGGRLRARPLAGVPGLGRLDPGRAVVAVQLPDDRPAERLLAVNRVCLEYGLTWL